MFPDGTTQSTAGAATDIYARVTANSASSNSIALQSALTFANGVNDTQNTNIKAAFDKANTGSVQTKSLQIIVVEYTTAVTNTVNIVGQVEIPMSGTITTIRGRTTTGTANVTFNIDGVSIGFVSANTMGVSKTVSANANTYSVLTLDTTAANGNGLLISMQIQ